MRAGVRKRVAGRRGLLRGALEVVLASPARGLELREPRLARLALGRRPGELRLGRARFEKKLRYYLDDDIDSNAIAEGARALLERDDVIIVASVSCIYGLGAPVDYGATVLKLRVGGRYRRDAVLRHRADIALHATTL